MVDIIMTTCNRKELTKRSIEALHERLKTKFRLIVIDDDSQDGTKELLLELREKGKIDTLCLNNFKQNICQAYNQGFKHVRSEYFITMQDDIIIPNLKTCVIAQLIGLMMKYPDHGAIACRIQKIPNLGWSEEDLTPARKALSAYFRIQKKEDIEKIGFGNRQWDDMAFVSLMRDTLKKKVSWANHLWCDHLGHNIENRGYTVIPRNWGVGSGGRINAPTKPYPEIDPETNIPLNLKSFYDTRS